MIDRREALRRLGVGALGLGLPGSLLGCVKSLSQRTAAGPLITEFDRMSPVDRFRARERLWSGDRDPERFHALLRGKPAVLKKRHGEHAPEKTRLLVIGGGMSGILSAYLLRDFQPVLLERAERFGGNARAESWENIEHPIGAAYISSPERGTPLHALYEKADVFSLCTKRPADESVLLSRKIHNGFWSGTTDPAAATQFTKVRDFFLDHLHGRKPLPAIPAETEEDIALLAEIDRSDFLSYLTKRLGEPLHPHVHTALELYCWGTFGASMQELSAALGMNYVAAEFGEVLVARAGNASIAERFLALLQRSVPLSRLRTGAVALGLREEKGHVEVSYVDKLGSLRRIHAEAVVLACPKFVARSLLGDAFGPEREEALARMAVRPYVVANACLRRPPARGLYEFFLLNEGEIPFGSTRRNQHNHGSAGVSIANFSQLERAGTVLTIYHPLPFEGGRAELMLPDSYGEFEKLFRNELLTGILPALGYQPQDLAELRLARWGHALPFAKPGFYWSGAYRALARPSGARVFFVNQDSWAAPAIETCAFEALRWSVSVRELLS